VEPIESGKVGRVAVGGVVQCKVSVTNSADKFVACQASTSELKTGSKGEGLILWKDDSTGWALVRLVSTAPAILRGTFTAPWPKGATSTVTDATASGTYTAKNYFASLTSTGTKACAIAYVGGEWILIAAECA
jgi:hypothetical protein